MSYLLWIVIEDRTGRKRAWGQATISNCLAIVLVFLSQWTLGFSRLLYFDRLRWLWFILFLAACKVIILFHKSDNGLASFKSIILDIVLFVLVFPVGMQRKVASRDQYLNADFDTLVAQGDFYTRTVGTGLSSELTGFLVLMLFILFIAWLIAINRIDSHRIYKKNDYYRLVDNSPLVTVDQNIRKQLSALAEYGTGLESDDKFNMYLFKNKVLGVYVPTGNHRNMVIETNSACYSPVTYKEFDLIDGIRDLWDTTFRPYFILMRGYDSNKFIEDSDLQEQWEKEYLVNNPKEIREFSVVQGEKTTVSYHIEKSDPIIMTLTLPDRIRCDNERIKKVIYFIENWKKDIKGFHRIHPGEYGEVIPKWQEYVDSLPATGNCLIDIWEKGDKVYFQQTDGWFTVRRGRVKLCRCPVPGYALPRLYRSK
ncbi:MAG: hypothetical protein IJ733_09560 [Lachnospiraceae bacterium]|nr:hypothetical protein [Lachnospiraceae bacterium]